MILQRLKNPTKGVGGGEWIGGVSGDLQVASLNFLEERREKILWKGDLTNITGIKRREREAK